MELKVATLVSLRTKGKRAFIHRVGDPTDFLYGNNVGAGGKLEVDIGETPEECAVRELKEEMGYISSKLKFRGHVLFDNRGRIFNGRPADKSWLVFLYEEFTEIEVPLSNEKGNLSRWVDEGLVSTLEMEEGDRQIFKWLEEGGEIYARIRYDGSRVKSYEGFRLLEGKKITLN